MPQVIFCHTFWVQSAFKIISKSLLWGFALFLVPYMVAQSFLPSSFQVEIIESEKWGGLFPFTLSSSLLPPKRTKRRAAAKGLLVAKLSTRFLFHQRVVRLSQRASGDSPSPQTVRGTPNDKKTEKKKKKKKKPGDGVEGKGRGGNFKEEERPKEKKSLLGTVSSCPLPFFCGVMSDPKKGKERERKGNKMQCDIFAAKYKQVYGQIFPCYTCKKTGLAWPSLP